MDRSGTEKSTTDAVVGLGVRSAFFLINNKNSVQILILESRKKKPNVRLIFLDYKIEIIRYNYDSITFFLTSFDLGIRKILVAVELARYISTLSGSC